MAGMLAGVECARRRRFHQSGLSSDSQNGTSQGWTRRPSFCLYTSNHEKSHHMSTSTSFVMQRGMLTQEDDHNLGVEAREAKERLDERLRNQRKCKPKTKNVKSKHSTLESDKNVVVKKETINNNNNTMNKKNSGGGSWRFMKWSKVSKKAFDQNECAICLEVFKGGETLVHLPCAHRFHNTCLSPWLVANSHCPCCRMGIVS